MATEREAVKATSSIPDPAADVEKPIETKEKRRARLASVLERGVVHDRLNVPLPADVYGEWFRNDPLEIHRAESLGFQIDTEYAPKRALHSDGSGKAIVGDVVHMICPREVKEVIDEINAERVKRVNDPRKSREEADFEAMTTQGTGGIIPPLLESKTHTVNAADIRAAIEADNANTVKVKP